MADLTQTAADVTQGAGASTETMTAGATVTRGMPVYKDSSDGNEVKPAQATSTKYAVVGIALNDAGDGQPVEVCTSATAIDVGATLTVGTVYVASANAAGAIAPVSDLTTGDYATVLGVATTTSVMTLTCGAKQQAAAPIA